MVSRTIVICLYFTDVHSKKCGSGLARESDVSVDLSGDWHTAFASKPAPTGDRGLAQ